MTRLKEQYDSQIKAAMMKKFGYKNEMQIPKLVKIVVNMGVGDAKENHKLLDSAIGDMEKITGQKAVVCKAKKSVANFKLREGMPIGCKVTLRGEKMYEFLDRLVNLALPNIIKMLPNLKRTPKNRIFQYFGVRSPKLQRQASH